MHDWTAGYVADLDYTFGYSNELDSGRIKMAFYNAGLVPPLVGTACELGFGQGVATNIHASASAVRWSGADFNTSQAAFAQSLALDSGNGAALFDEVFEQFCQRADLPEFDFIAMHGQWARFCWQVLQAQGQRIVSDGRPLATEAENLAELESQAAAFAGERLPVLRALGIAG